MLVRTALNVLHEPGMAEALQLQINATSTFQGEPLIPLMQIFSFLAIRATQRYFGVATGRAACGGRMCPSPNDDPSRPVVLVVDDESAIAGLLSEILEREGFKVLAFTSSVAVAKKLAEMQPDVVILDFEMPVITGPELAVMIRRNPTTETVPIIILSGLTHEEHHLIGKLSGATTYLAKPIDPAILIKTVRQVLGKP